MEITILSVLAKANAYYDALLRVSPDLMHTHVSQRFVDDYFMLRDLAIKVLPNLDIRLLGQSVTKLRETTKIATINYFEIEVYVRQIKSQLEIAYDLQIKSHKTYTLDSIREKIPKAYLPWSPEDDKLLLIRIQENATIEDLATEFSRSSGAIKSRLDKLNNPAYSNVKSHQRGTRSNIKSHQRSTQIPPPPSATLSDC